MRFPKLVDATGVGSGAKRTFIGAYGFEKRSTGWAASQKCPDALASAIVFRYVHPKGRNRVAELKRELCRIGASAITEVSYDVWAPHRIEQSAQRCLEDRLTGTEEVVLDITAMTKLMSLVTLCSLRTFGGRVRIVYSEAEDYAPTESEYQEWQSNMTKIACFPSKGVQSIVRTRCLSSIRMQGQPVCLIAFTSFNEQLIRHMLGTLSPHRFLFIGSKHPREDYAWRERAMQDVHERLIDEYHADNPKDSRGLLRRAASTLYYKDTFDVIDEAYAEHGTHERIICAATGTKMQTVGLFFAKAAHPDIHVEYPTPDSYYVKGLSTDIRRVHEVAIPRFRDFVASLRSGGPEPADYSFCAF